MRPANIIYILLLVIPSGLSAQDSSFTSKRNIQFYFPNEVVGSTSIQGINDLRNAWYSEYLSAMKEPVIYMDSSQNEIYRFTWLRTFHNPISIRITKNDSTCCVFWKQCSGQGGYNPGELTKSGHKTTDNQTWNRFLNKLNASDFWLLPTRPKESGKDGAQWILEAKTSQKYHVVDRWSPNRNSTYYQVCDFLLKLTDLKIKGGDKY